MVTRSQNPGALACGTTVSRSRGGKHTRCIFFQSQRNLRKFAKQTMDSPAAMAKLAIDRASIVFGNKNREIFIPNREIGRFSLFYQKSGDLPKNWETWKLWISTFPCNCFIIELTKEANSPCVTVLLQPNKQAAQPDYISFP